MSLTNTGSGTKPKPKQKTQTQTTKNKNKQPQNQTDQALFRTSLKEQKVRIRGPTQSETGR